MFKRMSILSRRPDDDRDYFARKWRLHGEIIARLPGLRAYIQNHVIEEINPAGIPADGIVELWFDSPQAMAEAFKTDTAREMAADEPSFLGRATGYALAAPIDAATGTANVPKLIVADLRSPSVLPRPSPWKDRWLIGRARSPMC